jgi:uncharacterized protein involved in exopolysaccharide biosynthesis
MEEEYYEIDLRRYIEALFRWWWVIALCALLAGLAALVVGMFQTPIYEANAGVVMLRSQTEISLGSSIQTLTDQDINVAEAARGATAERVEQRLSSMAGMVKNGAIAERVANELSDVLTEEEQRPSSLLGHVRGQILELEDGGGRSDTIEIVVSYDDPEKASAVANAWAQEYETYVNQIYGEASVAPFTDIEKQVSNARDEYDQAQESLLTFLSEDYRVSELQHQIEDTQAVINSLRSGQSTAVSAIVSKDAEVKQKLVNAYLESDLQNRLFAFNKGQEAKREILGAWIDAEVINRTSIITHDRELRQEMFNASVAAELDARMGVFQQQRQELLTNLRETYARKQRLKNLLSEARLMREQLIKGGASSSRSTGLALLALKTKVFNARDGLPFDTLDLQTTSVDGLAPNRSAAEQIADLDALIEAMEEDIVALDESIQEQSESLVSGSGYQQLDLLVPETATLSRPLTGTTDLAATNPASQTLGNFIVQRYNDLFDVGEMARSAEDVATETPLFAEIESLYPELFAQDAWMELAQSVPEQSELNELANQTVEDLLEMKGWGEVLSTPIHETPLAKEVADLEMEVRKLEAEIERLESKNARLQQDRDLAWQTYSALLSKQQEVEVAKDAKGTEVRFASPAVPPSSPVSPNTKRNAALAAAVGLMLGVGAAFLAEYMEMEVPDPYLLLNRLPLGKAGE